MHFVLRYIAISTVSIIAAVIYAYVNDRNSTASNSVAVETLSDKKNLKLRPVFYSLPPVICNLRFPSDKWIRLDVSIPVEPDTLETFNNLKDQISEDILVFVRTVSLPELEEDFGLIYLKTDLTERLQIRSENKLNEIVITSLVIQ